MGTHFLVSSGISGFSREFPCSLVSGFFSDFLKTSDFSGRVGKRLKGEDPKTSVFEVFSEVAHLDPFSVRDVLKTVSFSLFS